MRIILCLGSKVVKGILSQCVLTFVRENIDVED